MLSLAEDEFAWVMREDVIAQTSGQDGLPARC